MLHCQFTNNGTKLLTRNHCFFVNIDIFLKKTFFHRYNEIDDGTDDVGETRQISPIWLRMMTEVQAVRGVIWGVIVAALISLLSLLAFTSNVLVALLALMSQLATVFSMLALYYLMGWQMGVVEAISVSILIGLSVDYFFHLAEAYSISPAYGRRERTRDALTRMVHINWITILIIVLFFIVFKCLFFVNSIGCWCIEWCSNDRRGLITALVRHHRSILRIWCHCCVELDRRGHLGIHILHRLSRVDGPEVNRSLFPVVFVF